MLSPEPVQRSKRICEPATAKSAGLAELVTCVCWSISHCLEGDALAAVIHADAVGGVFKSDGAEPTVDGVANVHAAELGLAESDGLLRRDEAEVLDTDLRDLAGDLMFSTSA